MPGLNLFLEHLLDADWSVCAGNWMWISSSAFEDCLNCNGCINPVIFGRRFDRWGDYVRKFVPELAAFNPLHVHEPWKASLEEQEQSGCVLGRDYPFPIVDHQKVVKVNGTKMKRIKEELLAELMQAPKHCAPSSEDEIRNFLALEENCNMHED